jgi:hypothetical protein
MSQRAKVGNLLRPRYPSSMLCTIVDALHEAVGFPIVSEEFLRRQWCLVEYALASCLTKGGVFKTYKPAFSFAEL